jgi:hypothetical protein
MCSGAGHKAVVDDLQIEDGEAKELGLGGVASNPRANSNLKGALYVRLNPRMVLGGKALPNSIKMDTTNRDELQQLRDVATEFLAAPDDSKLQELLERAKADGDLSELDRSMLMQLRCQRETQQMLCKVRDIIRPDKIAAKATAAAIDALDRTQLKAKLREALQRVAEAEQRVKDAETRTAAAQDQAQRELLAAEIRKLKMAADETLAAQELEAARRESERLRKVLQNCE